MPVEPADPRRRTGRLTGQALVRLTVAFLAATPVPYGCTSAGTGPGAGAPPPPSSAAGRRPMDLGTNVQGIADYQRQPFFADLVKQGRPWYRRGNPNDLVPTDGDGWPVGDASIVLIAGGPIPGTAGTYSVTFRGKASVIPDAVAPPGSVRVIDQAHDPATRTTRAKLVVEPTAENVMLSFAGQLGGVKDLRVMRPGHAPDEVFARDFLARIAHFKALRFMQWMGPPSMGVNGQTDRAWSQRTTPGHAFQVAGQYGATSVLDPPTASSNRSPAWEWIILLANQTGKDAWITLPFFADDDYLTRVAQLFRFGGDGRNPYSSPQANPAYPPLRPDLKLYVEVSNELWNPGYGTTAANVNVVPLPWSARTTYSISYGGVGQRVRIGNGAAADVYELTGVPGGRAGASGRSGDVPPSGRTTFTGADGLTWTWRRVLGGTEGWDAAPHLDFEPGGRYEQSWRRTGWLAVRASRIFRSVFGDGEMMSRVRPVLGVQLARPATSTEPLRYIASVWGGADGKPNAFGNVAHPVDHYLYGIAGAPYVPSGNDFLDPRSADSLLDGIVANMDDRRPDYPMGAITRLGTLAGSHGIKALAYEGGQNLIPERMPGGATPSTLAASRSAQMSPRMNHEVYQRLLRHWFATPNAELFMNYTLVSAWNAGGYWGLSDDITTEATPKWDAVKAILSGP